MLTRHLSETETPLGPLDLCCKQIWVHKHRFKWSVVMRHV